MEEIQSSIIAIGTFDGVHLGHRKIIGKVFEEADRLKLIPKIYSFAPIPGVFFQQSGVQLISNIEEKNHLFCSFFNTKLNYLPFDEEVSQLSAFDFVEKKLIQQHGMRGIVMGSSHTFGKDQKGSYSWLVENKDKFSQKIEVFLVEDVLSEGSKVNSTNIRKLLKDGNIERANEWLGYTFSYEDTIVHGDKRGREIGFPTANFSLEDKLKLIPAEGIYAVWILCKGKFYKGMTYIGHRPTFEGIALRFETHLFDFDEMIYGERVRVFFAQKIRDDLKFVSVDKLISQMQEDKENSLLALEKTEIPTHY